MMADGGFSVEGRENIQEILSKQLYLCQVKIQGYVDNIFLLNISLGCPYSQNLLTPCNHLSFMVSTDFEKANDRLKFWVGRKFFRFTSKVFILCYVVL